MITKNFVFAQNNGPLQHEDSPISKLFLYLREKSNREKNNREKNSSNMYNQNSRSNIPNSYVYPTHIIDHEYEQAFINTYANDQMDHVQYQDNFHDPVANQQMLYLPKNPTYVNQQPHIHHMQNQPYYEPINSHVLQNIKPNTLNKIEKLPSNTLRVPMKKPQGNQTGKNLMADQKLHGSMANKPSPQQTKKFIKPNSKAIVQKGAKAPLKKDIKTPQRKVKKPAAMPK